MAKSGTTTSIARLKTFCLYLFLLFLGYVTADLVLLKFLRPQFVYKPTAKSKLNRVSTIEPETKGFDPSEIGDRDKLTNKIVSRNIFNAKPMPQPLAKLKKGPKTQDFEDADPVLSGLQLTLEGTAVHRNPFRSLATITNGQKTRTFTVGDEIEGLAEIISVIRKKVIIRNSKNRRLEYIEIKRDQKKPAPVARRNQFRKPPSRFQNKLIKQDGNRFTAKRADVNAQLNNITALSRQANSRLYRDPATGEAIGYQIYGIKPGLLQSLGVKDNDIILNINGMKINNPGKAMSAYNSLKSASEINLTVRRDGSDVDLEYIIE